MDEIDALTGARSDGENDSIRRIKTEFLIQVIKRPTIFARSRQQLAYSCELRMIQMTAAASAASGKSVTTVGATNLPWDLDPAFRRCAEPTNLFLLQSCGQGTRGAQVPRQIHSTRSTMLTGVSCVTPDHHAAGSIGGFTSACRTAPRGCR